MDGAAGQARSSRRRRAIFKYHEHKDAVQRMLNAVEPDSYVRPRRHQEPDKVEVFLCLRGRALLVAFDDDRVSQRLELSDDGPVRGGEVPPRAWHSLLALERGLCCTK